MPAEQQESRREEIGRGWLVGRWVHKQWSARGTLVCWCRGTMSVSLTQTSIDFTAASQASTYITMTDHDNHNDQTSHLDARSIRSSYAAVTNSPPNRHPGQQFAKAPQQYFLAGWTPDVHQPLHQPIHSSEHLAVTRTSVPSASLQDIFT